MNKKQILYLSYFYPMDVVRSRKLPTRNIAGNNRIKRITGALASAGWGVHIVTPGICAKCGFSAQLLHGTYTTREDGIDVTVAPAVGVPLLGALLEILLFPLWLLQFVYRNRFDGAVFYNYSLSFVLVAVILRMFGIPIVAEVEDIAVPSLSDWRPGAETRPVQQLVMWFCMRIITGLSTGLLVPSQRFLRSLPAGKTSLVISGCIADSEWGEERPVQLREPIRVLFVGGYEIEHGVDVFVDALKLLRSEPSLGSKFVVDCCGTRNYPSALQSLSQAEGQPAIRLHGLLSDEEYRNLLAETSVALVLQKGKGRHAYFKSPSKAYEFLAAGKLVVSTDVGDLASLGGSHLILMQHESAEELVRILGEIAEDPQKYEAIALAARTFSLREATYAAVGSKLTAFLTQAFNLDHSRRRGPQENAKPGDVHR